jgi:choline dehydrogenase-like flavoprotein
MARDPAEGVVDANCRVFGVHNLSLAGSAVFPTSGQANPTLTLVALAVRLAHHIDAEAGRAPGIVGSPRTIAPLHARARDPQPVVDAAAITEPQA